MSAPVDTADGPGRRGEHLSVPDLTDAPVSADAIERAVSAMVTDEGRPGRWHPARLCDLDHVVPFPHGPTVPGNLLTLCRHHHRLKHHTRWEPRLDRLTGEVTWTDPQGTIWTTEGQELRAPHPQPDG